MTKEELEKEAREYYRKNFKKIITDRNVWTSTENAYIAGAEPREKRITELEDKLANADYQLEGRDLEVMEFKAELEREKNLNQCLSDHNEQLRELIEKMRDCLKRWYEQKGQKYTDTFYENLMRDTEKYLWADVGN